MLGVVFGGGGGGKVIAAETTILYLGSKEAEM